MRKTILIIVVLIVVGVIGYVAYTHNTPAGVQITSPVPGSTVGFDIRAAGTVPLSWHTKNNGITVTLKQENGTTIQNVWTPVTRTPNGYTFSADFVEGGGMAGELTPYQGPAEVVVTGYGATETYSIPFTIKASGVNAF